MFGGTGSGPRLPTAPRLWNFPQLCPHCSLTACQKLFVEPPWRSLWPGWTAPEETSYWCPRLGPGTADPAWPPLSPSVPVAPALLHPEGLLWLWGCGAGAQGTLTSAGEQPGCGRAVSIHVDKGWLPTRYGSVLVSMPCPGRGVKSSDTWTVLTTVSPTLPQCLPKTPGRNPYARAIFPAPRRDSTQTQGSATWPGAEYHRGGRIQ